MIEKSCTLSMNGYPTRIRKRNQFSQSRWSFTKVMPMEKTYTGYKRGSKCCTNSPTYPFLRHIWCAILLNDIMDLHMSYLGKFVPEGPWCIMQQGVKFTEVWHVMWLFTSTLIWYHTHINTRTQRHTAHFGASRMIHLYKSILTPRACAHSSYLYYFEYVVHCISKIYSPECLFFF